MKANPVIRAVRTKDFLDEVAFKKYGAIFSYLASYEQKEVLEIVAQYEQIARDFFKEKSNDCN